MLENDTIQTHEHATNTKFTRTHITQTKPLMTRQRPISNNYLPIEPRYTLSQYIHSHPNAVIAHAHHPAQWLNRKDTYKNTISRAHTHNKTCTLKTQPPLTLQLTQHFSILIVQNLVSSSKFCIEAIDI